jgi:hypothetical protein
MTKKAKAGRKPPVEISNPIRSMFQSAADAYGQIVERLEDESPNFDSALRAALLPLENLERECRNQADNSRQAAPLGSAISMMSSMAGSGATSLKDVGDDLARAARLAEAYDRLADQAKAMRTELSGILTEDRDSVLKVVTGLRDFCRAAVKDL